MFALALEPGLKITSTEIWFWRIRAQPTHMRMWVETWFVLVPPHVHALETLPEHSGAGERHTLSRSSRASAINATLDCCMDLTRIDPGRVWTHANQVQPG